MVSTSHLPLNKVKNIKLKIIIRQTLMKKIKTHYLSFVISYLSFVISHIFLLFFLNIIILFIFKILYPFSYCFFFFFFFAKTI